MHPVFTAMGKPPGTCIIEMLFTPMGSPLGIYTHGHFTGVVTPVEKLLGIHTMLTVLGICAWSQGLECSQLW